MTTFNSDVVLANGPRSAHGEAKEHQSFLGTAALTAALALNDVINLGMLPAYARVVGACLSSDRLDSGTTIAFSVGDNGYGTSPGVVVAADTTRYFSATTIGRAAAPANANAVSAMDGKAQNFRNNQGQPLLIFATVTAAATTPLAGNLFLRLTYYIDEPGSLLNQ